MMKRFLQRKNTRMYHVWLRSFMVCLCLALAGVSAWGQDNIFSGGSGTETDPYLIKTVGDLKEMVKVNREPAHFRLNNDIDLGERKWTPLKWVSYEDVVFDGAGYSITGLYIDGDDMTSGSDYTAYQAGLFSTIDRITIKNLTVEGKIINAKCQVGGICGYSNNTIIENCCNRVNITAVSTVQNAVPNNNILMVGGIVGANGGTINKCWNEGVIKIDGKSIIDDPIGFYLGGICGMSTSSISRCYNKGGLKILAEKLISNFYVGGICGLMQGVPLENCYNQGAIDVSKCSTTGTVYVGGITGNGELAVGEAITIQYCYNTGSLIGNEQSVIGGICGLLKCGWIDVINKITNNYYLTQEGINAVGKQAEGTVVENTVESKNNPAFTTGEVAWLLRQLNEEDGSYVFGQNLNGNPSGEYPKLQCFDGELPAVYQLKYTTSDNKEVIQYYNPGQTTEALPELESDLRWFGEDGTIYESGFSMPAKDLAHTAEPGYSITKQVEHGTISIAPNQTLYKAGTPITVTVKADEGYQFKSLECKTADTDVSVTNNNDGTYSFTMPDADVTITAQFELIPPVTYTITIDPNIQNGTVISNQAQAAAGETITLTVTPTDGYELSELYYMVGTEKNPITGTTFTMPAANVTVYATFTEKEDPTDPEEPVDPPVDPINYYNIYNETTYDFIDVSFSRNVVREGGSVNVYLEIPEGLDPAAVTLMFKRGMYDGWRTLDVDDEGNYRIDNIWTHIYVKAVVDESYIDPEPDENHIYIDLSETNDSIWLYTDHKLVEEGKTAVIQAEVAKSCQNKEIRYMYKRTVLGEWKEMPKDYSINQYVVRDITTDIYVKAYFVFDKQDPTTAKNPHHVYADITATCEGLYLDATRHKVADEGDTKVFLYVKKGFETKDARYLFKRGLKGEWEDLVPGIEQNTFQVTAIEGDIYLKGIDAVYTGTEDIDGMVRVYTKDGSLFVYTAQPEEISVVSMTGVTVKRTRQTGLQSYPLNQGIYVICVGEQVFKVRVK
ncbi:MAG: hypothetical protein KIH02_09315 [Parabacteroides sp.]|nr:hypothetical protein [Parabacteroides sp.]